MAAEPLEIAIPNIEYFDVVHVAHTGVQMLMPVEIGPPGKRFRFPIEPLVSVRGRKIITRRTIAKRKSVGSVKEVWSVDDYEITIAGQLYNPDFDGFPTELVSTLNGIFLSTKMLDISCALTDALGIFNVCIESMDLPATPGIQRQDFVIRCFSDNDFDLL
jgi:hypothetical protein